MKQSNLGLIGLAAAASVLVAGCATPNTNSGYRTPAPYGSTATCADCGTVVRIEQVGSRVPNATGAVLGGLVGAAAGRELADDESSGRRNTATVGGAVAGAVAGNAIQNRMGAGTNYNVHVRMNDGRTTVVTQNDLGGIRDGSQVRVYNGRAWVR